MKLGPELNHSPGTQYGAVAFDIQLGVLTWRPAWGMSLALAASGRKAHASSDCRMEDRLAMLVKSAASKVKGQLSCIFIKFLFSEMYLDNRRMPKVNFLQEERFFIEDWGSRQMNLM